MAEEYKYPEVSFRPEWEGCKLDFGIGLIGAGGAANWAHFPTYHYAGLKVVAVAETNESLRRKANCRWLVDNVFADYRRLVEMDEVDVVDITIHHDHDDLRLEVVKAAAEAGKHILIQKPLALNYETAKSIVSIAKQNGVKLAVNQNFRWNPSSYGAKQLVMQGYIGDIRTITIENITPADWVYDAHSEPCYDLIAWSIHSLDLFRYWLNSDPLTVYAKTYNHNHLVLSQFPNNAQTVLIENGLDGGGADDFSFRFRITGTKGTIKGGIGCHAFQKMPLDYLKLVSSSFPNSVKWQSISLPADISTLGERIKPPVYDLSSPYAGFLGAMGSLMVAVYENREPEVDGEDNLRSLKYAFAPYESTRLNREVSLGELEKDHLYKKSGKLAKDEK